jgi:hypothetical protein
MTFDEAANDYFSKVIGLLIGLLLLNKIITEEKAEHLIGIVQDGLKEIAIKFNIEKILLDPKAQI